MGQGSRRIGLVFAFLGDGKVFHARQGWLLWMMTQQPDFEVRDLIGQSKDSVTGCLRHGNPDLKSKVETISHRPECFSDSSHFTGVYERDDLVLDVSHVVSLILSVIDTMRCYGVLGHCARACKNPGSFHSYSIVAGRRRFHTRGPKSFS